MPTKVEPRTCPLRTRLTLGVLLMKVQGRSTHRAIHGRACLARVRVSVPLPGHSMQPPTPPSGIPHGGIAVGAAARCRAVTRMFLDTTGNELHLSVRKPIKCYEGDVNCQSRFRTKVIVRGGGAMTQLTRAGPLMHVMAAVGILAAYLPAATSAHSIPGNGSHTTAFPQDTPAKLALIIAIAEYPVAVTGIPPLNSDNDIPLIRGSLAAQGFDSADIRILRDADATRLGIVSAMRDLAGRARAGDIVFIHYSGHGHRITDDNGDEIDGYDEVLVPYDAPADPPADYHGELHLRDDELGSLIADLQQAVGASGNVVLSVDACFSGSVTRALREVRERGIRDPIGPPAATASRGVMEPGGGFLEGVVPATRGSGGAASGSYVVFSAARHDEPSWETLSPEGLPVGSLSLALGEALSEVRAGATYRDLFHRVKEKMALSAPLQTPQMEGNADMEVFSGETVAQESFFRIQDAPSDSVVILRGGALVGILPGTRFELHPAGTRDPAAGAGLGAGTANRVTALRTEVLLDGPINAEDLANAWAFVTARSFGEFRARLRLDRMTVEERSTLEGALEDAGTVQIVTDDPDLVLQPATSGDQLVLVSAWDGALVLGPLSRSSNAWVSRVVSRARAYALNRLLARVEMSAPDMDVRLRVLPARHRFDLNGGCDAERSELLDAESALSTGGQWTFAPGDGYLLEIVNEGRSGAYVTVLDLMPDGQIEQLFPRPDLSGEDNLLEAGMSYRVRLCYEVAEPFGLEIVKLFATREPVDFLPIVRSGRVSRSVSALSPLEQVFAEALDGTRSVVGARAASAGQTHATTLHVVPTARKERR